MLTRTLVEGVALAATGKHFKVKDYTWHKYTGDKGVKLVDERGRSVKLSKGDLYGVKEATRTQDRYLVLKMPNVIFKVDIPRSDKIMDRSKEYKGKIKQSDLGDPVKATKPTKIKVDLTKPKKPAKPSKPVQPDVESKKLAVKKEKELKKTTKPSKVKVQVRPTIEDEDPVPAGHVLHGGKLITPDELEIDEDLSWLDLPIPKSYRSMSSTPVYCVSYDPAAELRRSNFLVVTDDLETAKAKMMAKKMGIPIHQLTVNPRHIFDLRKPQCKEDYNVIRESNPDLKLPTINDPALTWPHTGVPRVEFVERLRDYLVDLSYDSMYVVEGPTGNSMALFHPNVIVGKVKLDI
jgi:hypothetical protein